MKYAEFKRWLAAREATFQEGAKHIKIYCNGRQTTLPQHGGEIGEGLRKAILKQLGIADRP